MVLGFDSSGAEPILGFSKIGEGLALGRMNHLKFCGIREMMKVMKFGVVLFASLAILIGCGHSVGKTMPSFSMKTLNGKSFTNRDVAGRVAVFYVSGEG